MEILQVCIDDIGKYWIDFRLETSLAIALGFLGGSIAILYQKNRGIKIRKQDWLYKLVVFGGDSVYLTYTFLITLGMRHIGQRCEIKLIPFRDISSNPRNLATLLENILLFVPFGILAPLTSRKFQNGKIIIWTALVLSVLIETLQYIFRCGKSEVDDCILNWLGAVIGYLIYRLGMFIVNMMKKIDCRYEN